MSSPSFDQEEHRELAMLRELTEVEGLLAHVEHMEDEVGKYLEEIQRKLEELS